MGLPKSHIAVRGSEGTVKGYRVVPYARMVHAGQAIGVQRGTFVNDQGGIIEDAQVPAWAKDRLARMNPGRRAALGMERFDKVPPSELIPEQESDETEEDETEENED